MADEDKIEDESDDSIVSDLVRRFEMRGKSIFNYLKNKKNLKSIWRVIVESFVVAGMISVVSFGYKGCQYIEKSEEHLSGIRQSMQKLGDIENKLGSIEEVTSKLKKYIYEGDDNVVAKLGNLEDIYKKLEDFNKTYHKLNTSVDNLEKTILKEMGNVKGSVGEIKGRLSAKYVGAKIIDYDGSSKELMIKDAGTGREFPLRLDEETIILKGSERKSPAILKEGYEVDIVTEKDRVRQIYLYESPRKPF